MPKGRRFVYDSDLIVGLKQPVNYQEQIQSVSVSQFLLSPKLFGSVESFGKVEWSVEQLGVKFTWIVQSPPSMGSCFVPTNRIHSVNMFQLYTCRKSILELSKAKRYVTVNIKIQFKNTIHKPNLERFAVTLKTEWALLLIELQDHIQHNSSKDK